MLATIFCSSVHQMTLSVIEIPLIVDVSLWVIQKLFLKLG